MAAISPLWTLSNVYIACHVHSFGTIEEFKYWDMSDWQTLKGKEMKQSTKVTWPNMCLFHSP
jgi:hypothetical protein